MIKAIMSRRDFQIFYLSYGNICNPYYGEVVPVRAISISDVGSRGMMFTDTDLVEVLSLFFDDEEDGPTAMTKEDSQRIAEFLKDWDGEVVVHCGAGISRSAAVAAAICIGKGWDEKWIWNNGKFCPNRRCYRLTCEAFGFVINGSSFLEQEESNFETNLAEWKKENDVED